MSLRNKKILKDYKIEYTAGEDGRQKAQVTYTGDYYVSALPTQRRVMLRRAVLAFLVTAFCASVAVLIPNTRSSFQAYVVLPQVLALAALATSAYYASPLFYRSARLTYKQMLYVTHTSKNAAAASAVLSAAAVLGRIVFLGLFYSADTAAAELALFAGSLAAAGLCVALFWVLKRVSYIKE